MSQRRELVGIGFQAVCNKQRSRSWEFCKFFILLRHVVLTLFSIENYIEMMCPPQCTKSPFFSLDRLEVKDVRYSF